MASVILSEAKDLWLDLRESSRRSLASLGMTPLIALLLAACSPVVETGPRSGPDPRSPFVFILGIAQDGGYPQAGCNADHCRIAWENPSLKRNVTSLAIIDPTSRQRWVIDATPDFPDQLRVMDEVSPRTGIAGIFLTHAHVGHYTGLIHLGREVMGSREIPVYAMPRLHEFLGGNGPWQQLVQLGNIRLMPLSDGQPIELNERISITPLLVPHRDEYSETVGFRIEGPRQSVLFIPDIDKWERWSTRIEDLIGEVDVALLDGTFYDDSELPGRNMAEIPHPFIVESLQRFEFLEPAQRLKVQFIHLNHTNPALQLSSPERRSLEAAGYRIAEQYSRIAL